MRILYAIQGTGNGHLSRASEIIPLLKQYGEVDILVSGNNSDLSISFEINYQLSGLSFAFGKHGDIEFIKTFRQIDFKTLIKEIKYLPVNKYDLVINDFEPVSAWAAWLKNIPCYSLSHQSAVASKYSPKPEIKNWIGQLILHFYAPTKHQYGFHFKPYSQGIFTPVIRQEIRRLTVTNDGHYTVYLPAYDDKILIQQLNKFKAVKWKIFSKHCKHRYCVENITIEPISHSTFIRSMASGEGILCGAGFETPAEALFLKKKLMVIPMKSQYEQQCNAASLKQMGVPVLKDLKNKRVDEIEKWLCSKDQIEICYPDITQSVIDEMIEHFFLENPKLSLIRIYKL